MLSSAELEFSKAYIEFQKKSHSPFHVVSAIENELLENGFEDYKKAQKAQRGKKYFIKHQDDKTIFAFVVPKDFKGSSGFALIGAHTDSPAFRLKLNPFSESEGVVRLNPQVHGGMIFRSWLDRPLYLSGKVYHLKKNKGIIQKNPINGMPILEESLVSSAFPIGVIPDLAFHMDRLKNEGTKLNPETMMGVVISTLNELTESRDALARALEIDDLGDGFELYLAPSYPHEFVGVDRSMILGPRHDNLAMCFPAYKALLNPDILNAQMLPFVCLFSSEETGSQTASGARSSFLNQVLDQLLEDLDPGAKSLQVYENSFMLSADMAHGAHPGYKECHDANHRPALNGGIVIKDNANDSYATNGLSATFVRGLCHLAGVPVQEFVIRQDLTCGSTVGPIISAKLGCLTADIGAAMWGMHSAAETMGVKDLLYFHKLFETFVLGSSSHV